MQAPPNREKKIWTTVCAAMLAGLAVLAWQALGGLGVGLLGLLVLFVAVRVELEGDSPVGTHSTPEAYGSHIRTERERPAAERASRRAEVAAFVSSVRMFIIAGAVLTITGVGLIFFGPGQREPSALLLSFGGALWNSFQRGKPW